MKNKIAIASAFLAAASFSTAEIVVNDFLSFEGFVDMSYLHSDSSADAGNGFKFNDSENSYAVDQVEISWLFNFDAVTAQVDLQYEGGSNYGGHSEDGELVEQAFVNYALGNGDVITAGRYASMLGFEAYEPTGLYQYSTAYSMSGEVFSMASEYVQGVKYSRTTDTTFFGISLQDQAFGHDAGRLGGNSGDGDSSFAVEVAGSMDLGNGLTVFAGAAFEDVDSGDYQLVNTYVTYETGAWLFAAEINVSESDVGPGSDSADGVTGLVMANYAYSDVASVTGRLSSINYEIGDFLEMDFLKYTLAHNQALADNLLLVTEISYENGDFGMGPQVVDFDYLVFAVELLFSF
jgi:hypothetical protein